MLSNRGDFSHVDFRGGFCIEPVRIVSSHTYNKSIRPSNTDAALRRHLSLPVRISVFTFGPGTSAGESSATPSIPRGIAQNSAGSWS